MEVHVDRKRGGRGATGEPRLLAQNVGEAEPQAAELPRRGGDQIAGRAQIGQVFVKEAVFSVVFGRSGRNAPQQVVIEDAAFGRSFRVRPRGRNTNGIGFAHRQSISEKNSNC
jgi:hypothetical protein